MSDIQAKLVKSATKGGHSTKWRGGQFAYVASKVAWGVEYTDHHGFRSTVHFHRKKDAVAAFEAITEMGWDGRGDLATVAFQWLHENDRPRTAGWKGEA